MEKNNNKRENSPSHPLTHKKKGLAKAPPRSLCQQPRSQGTQKEPLESQVHPMGKVAKRVKKRHRARVKIS